MVFSELGPPEAKNGNPDRHRPRGSDMIWGKPLAIKKKKKKRKEKEKKARDSLTALQHTPRKDTPT